MFSIALLLLLNLYSSCSANFNNQRVLSTLPRIKRADLPRKLTKMVWPKPLCSFASEFDWVRHGPPTFLYSKTRSKLPVGWRVPPLRGFYKGVQAADIQTSPKWNATWTDKLKRDLLSTYDKFARPAQHTNVTVINVRMTFHHVDLDEEKSTLTMYCWMYMDWTDEKLTWNASDYGGLTVLHVADHEVWQPDICPYNSASGNSLEYYGHSNHLVYENGMIIWVPPTLFHVFCEINLRNWPFDVQECYLRIGSWTYSGEMVDLQIKDTDDEIGDIAPSTEWQLLKIVKSRNIKYYDCCTEPYVDITYNMTLARRSPSYKALVITPITAIVFMTLATFWLPPTSGDKIILGASTALIICLFLLYFTQKLPVIAGHTPLIVIFYSSSLYMVSFSIVLSVIVINIAKNPSFSPLPWFLKHPLTGLLGRCLFLHSYISQTSSLHHSITSTPGNEELKENEPVFSEQQDIAEVQSIGTTSSKQSHGDWILLAVAVDRLSFILYCVIFAILAMGCAV